MSLDFLQYVDGMIGRSATQLSEVSKWKNVDGDDDEPETGSDAPALDLLRSLSHGGL